MTGPQRRGITYALAACACGLVVAASLVTSTHETSEGRPSPQQPKWATREPSVARYTAALCGAFWSFMDIKTRRPVSDHDGRHGCHSLDVDPITGTVTVSLMGGQGTYSVDYYVDGVRLPYTVATCHQGGTGLELSREARWRGWRMQAAPNGGILTPP